MDITRRTRWPSRRRAGAAASFALLALAASSLPAAAQAVHSGIGGSAPR